MLLLEQQGDDIKHVFFMCAEDLRTAGVQAVAESRAEEDAYLSRGAVDEGGCQRGVQKQFNSKKERERALVSE